MRGETDSVGREKAARTTGLSRQTVYRIKEAPDEAVASLAEWGL
jgi:DNA-binding XRE family transcriptional regulator